MATKKKPAGKTQAKKAAQPKTTKGKCKDKNKSGDPCGARPLRKGTLIEGHKATGGYCRSHDPALPGSARFGSKTQAKKAGVQGGRPRVPRPTEIQRRLVEDNMIAVLGPYWKALGHELRRDDNGDIVAVPLTGGGLKISFNYEGKLVVTDVDDIGAQIAVAEKLQDRAHGRPSQKTEITGVDDGPVRISAELLTDEGLRNDLLSAVARVAAARSGKPSGPRARD